MKLSTLKPLFSTLLLSLLLTTTGYVSASESINLKQTMKQMRLQYKEALETTSAESFNNNIDQFKLHLKSAQGYTFSPERKAISLEGLNKVERFMSEIPQANADNLAQLQLQLRQVDQLRKEYHDKAKPGIWDLFLSLFK